MNYINPKKKINEENKMPILQILIERERERKRDRERVTRVFVVK